MKSKKSKLKPQKQQMDIPVVSSSLFNVGDEIGVETNIERLIDVVRINKVVKHPKIEGQFIYHLSNGNTMVDL